jgi:RNA polymerase sigma factor (sigma-70 family)
LAAVPSIGRASLVERPHVAPHAEATHGLYERHAARIQAYCHHQLGSREEAEDAVQTTFMNAFRALGRGVVPEAETAWLFKIAENVCLSRRRSTWRRGRIESPSDFDVIEEVVPGPSRQRDELIGIEDALASMPEQQRRAILLREWQGLSYREIAEELEISQSAVETLIFRARRSLAQGLEQPDLFKRPKRKGLRRALRALDLGSLAAAAKTLLSAGAAAKATAAAAVAVTAAAGTGATVVAKHHEGHSPKSTPVPAVVQKAVPAPAETPAAVRFAPAAPSAASAPAAVRSERPAKPAPTKTQTQVAPVAAAAPAPAPVAATHQPAPAPAAAAPQPEAQVAAPVPVAEPKNDEGPSDRTERRPEAAAPVATTTVAPAPQVVQPVTTETTEPVLSIVSPKPTLDVISPTYEPTPVTTTSSRTTTTVALEPTPVTTTEPMTTTYTTPITTTTTTSTYTTTWTSGSTRGTR